MSETVFEVPERYREAVDEFHRMWDAFPGPARLTLPDHTVLAVNEPAVAGGFYEGCTCSTVRAPQTHRGCKLAAMFKTGQSQVQRFGERKIKGWMPVGGYPDLCVHYAISIPEDNQQDK